MVRKLPFPHTKAEAWGLPTEREFVLGTDTDGEMGIKQKSVYRYEIHSSIPLFGSWHHSSTAR